MPLALDLAHKILQELSLIRNEKNSKMSYLRPDAKSQVTIEYDDQDRPIRIDTMVVSTQHDPFDKDEKMLAKIKKDVIEIVVPRVKAKCKKSIQKLFNDKIVYHVNPTGKFVSADRMAIPGLPVARSLLTRMAVREHMVVELLAVKIPQRLIAALHMLQGISPRIWWPQVWQTKFWYRYLMQSVLQSR